MKRIVLSGYFGFKNFGDEAILSVLVNKLQDDRHRLTVISHDPSYTKSLYKHIRSVYTFNFRDIIGAISKSDILISGGGSLLQDVTSAKSLIYYLLIIFIALLLRKKVVIFAQGLGPINNQFCQFLTKLILKHCDYISVRDEKSKLLLQNWGIKSDLVCDPIFSLKFNEQLNKNSDYVAIQLRDFKTMNNDFIERLALEVNKRFKDKNIEIYSFQDDIDFEVCKNFEKQLKMLNPDIKCKLYHNMSIHNCIYSIIKCKYLIGMRFHSIIMGLIAGCKIVGINYDIKVEKLAREFNIPLIDLKNDFGNAFENLDMQSYVVDKLFDWSGLEKVLNEN